MDNKYLEKMALFGIFAKTPEQKHARAEQKYEATLDTLHTSYHDYLEPHIKALHPKWNRSKENLGKYIDTVKTTLKSNPQLQLEHEKAYSKYLEVAKLNAPEKHKELSKVSAKQQLDKTIDDMYEGTLGEYRVLAHSLREEILGRVDDTASQLRDDLERDE